MQPWISQDGNTINLAQFHWKLREVIVAKIGLGVSSSVSIYKACEIIRRLQEREYEVQVMMTKNSTHFISPLLFSALSGHKVIVDPFEEEYSGTIAHVSLAQEISLLFVAPATANIIAKFAAGIADDFFYHYCFVIAYRLKYITVKIWKLL